MGRDVSIMTINWEISARKKSLWQLALPLAAVRDLTAAPGSEGSILNRVIKLRNKPATLQG